MVIYYKYKEYYRFTFDINYSPISLKNNEELKIYLFEVIFFSYS